MIKSFLSGFETGSKLNGCIVDILRTKSDPFELVDKIIDEDIKKFVDLHYDSSIFTQMSNHLGVIAGMVLRSPSDYLLWLRYGYKHSKVLN